ncbi:MAG: hypothetical protein R3194_08970 [Limnobacter sp.]|nr:hypothetical protein [Limnobacter sp.]
MIAKYTALTALLMGLAGASFTFAQETAPSGNNSPDTAQSAGSFIEDAPAPTSALDQGNCVFAVEQVDPAELTVEQQIELADRMFNDSLHASNDCLSNVQSEAASGGYAGGGGSGGAGGVGSASGQANAGPVTDQKQQGNTARNETEPVGNGRMDQGSIETDADKQICDELRAQAKSARTASEKADIEQAAKEFGCAGV